MVSAKVQGLADKIKNADNQEEVVRQLVKMLQDTTPWYRDVEVAFHPNGQLHHIKYEITAAIRYPAIILSVGLVAWLAAPVIITSLTALIELCIVEVGFEAVIALVSMFV